MKYESLSEGDEIRVIAPSSRKEESNDPAELGRSLERLQSLGYRVTFGNHLESELHLGTAAREHRAADFNDAFADESVKAVLSYRGGWSANEILPLIDWELVKANPKPIIGFSDITVLLNAIHAKTGNIGLLGPNYRTIGQQTSWEYTLSSLHTNLRQEYPIELTPSERWSPVSGDERPTDPWKSVSPGTAEGVLLGGNLGTLYLLQGTEYQPKFDEPFIFALEDDDEAGEYTAREVSRRLESLLQLPNFRNNMQALIIGRFPPASAVTYEEVVSIVESKQLGDKPVVAGVDFGHTVPTATLPIGGRVRVVSGDDAIKITLL